MRPCFRYPGRGPPQYHAIPPPGPLRPVCPSARTPKSAEHPKIIAITRKSRQITRKIMRGHPYFRPNFTPNFTRTPKDSPSFSCTRRPGRLKSEKLPDLARFRSIWACSGLPTLTAEPPQEVCFAAVCSGLLAQFATSAENRRKHWAYIGFMRLVWVCTKVKITPETA